MPNITDQSVAGLYVDWGVTPGFPAPIDVAMRIKRDLRAAGWRPPAHIRPMEIQYSRGPEEV